MSNEIIEENQAHSTTYRLMIYFVVATLHFYHDDIFCDKIMTVGEFRRRNDIVCQVVCGEGLKYMSYELSDEQMNRGVLAYLEGLYSPTSINTQNKEI